MAWPRAPGVLVLAELVRFACGASGTWMLKACLVSRKWFIRGRRLVERADLMEPETVEGRSGWQVKFWMEVFS